MFAVFVSPEQEKRESSQTGKVSLHNTLQAYPEQILSRSKRTQLCTHSHTHAETCSRRNNVHFWFLGNVFWYCARGWVWLFFNVGNLNMPSRIFDVKFKNNIGTHYK